MPAVIALARLITVTVGTLLLSGCYRANTTASLPTPAPVATNLPGYVSRVAMGDKWPFTSDDGVVGCADLNCVTFTTGGVTYAVNDTARERAKTDHTDQHEWIDLRTSFLWAPDPTGTRGSRKDLRPIIDIGLSLCHAARH
jgi:hypothetical protein